MNLRGDAVALDTNLLLLHLACANETLAGLIGKWKRLNNFVPSDAISLAVLLAHFRGHVTTAHILTEASNFVDHTPAPYRELMLSSFHAYIHASIEKTTPARELSNQASFRNLGLADCALIDLPPNCNVITMDYHLATKRQQTGAAVSNFNHFRDT